MRFDFRSLLRWTLPLLCVAGLAGATSPAPTPTVHIFKLSMSNVYAIVGQRVVLVDAAGRINMPALDAAMASAGIRWADVGAVVVTHGHSDHAGLAAEIQQKHKVPIVLGKGDVPMAAAGHNDDLKPTSFFASLLKRFAIDPSYPPFTPDIVVDEPLSMQAWGIEGRIRQLPGHTPGSLVVELADGRTFVGDMMLGGYLGGTFAAGQASEHYFHADRAMNLANIHTLLNTPATRFFLGHGGPVDRESVIAAFGTGQKQ